MKCEICEQEFFGAWSDFHGEKVCQTCGAPYQTASYSGAPKDQIYPYLNVSDKWIPILKEYWNGTKRCGVYGMFLSQTAKMQEQMKHFSNWIRENHPELTNK